MQRREFLGVMTMAASSGLGATALESAAAREEPPLTDLPRPDDIVRGDMRYRKLGRTGEEVSLVGLGGYHIGVPKNEADGIDLIRSAIDAGITFMDNSWD